MLQPFRAPRPFEDPADSPFGAHDLMMPGRRLPRAIPGPVDVSDLDELLHEAQIEMMASVPSAPVSSLALSTALVAAARHEWKRWNEPRHYTERNPQAREILLNYWKIGPNWDVTDAQLDDPAWQDNHPWSAAFISYVARMAGADTQFKYSAKHAVYIKWSIENRLRNRDVAFKGYRLHEVKPEPGDLLGKERSGSGANYDTIQRPDFFPNTHCDVVTKVEAGHLLSIGGNVGDSVTETRVSLDNRGYVNQSAYFVVIKVTGPAPARVPDLRSGLGRA